MNSLELESDFCSQAFKKARRDGYNFKKGRSRSLDEPQGESIRMTASQRVDEIAKHEGELAKIWVRMNTIIFVFPR